MVYPVFENMFKIGTNGRESGSEDMAVVADITTFSPSFSNNVETWTPMDLKGWQRAMQTGKAFTISFKGKRNVGDAGNDYIAGLAWKTGNDVNTVLEMTFPDKTKIKVNVVVDVKALGGDSTNVGVLEFDCISDGAPEVSTTV